MAIEKLKLKQLQTFTDGFHSDGGNLYLQVLNSGRNRSWVFRFTCPVTGKPDQRMGLGSLDTVHADEARAEARKVRALLRDGKNPIAERHRLKLDSAIAAGRTKTVRELMDEWYPIKMAHKSANTRAQVANIIDRHIVKRIGDMPVARVDTKVILDDSGIGLQRLWCASRKDGGRHPTALRLRGILERAFSFAISHKYYTDKNPASKEALDSALSDSADVHKTTHRLSLPLEDLGRFLQVLRSYKDRSVRKTGRLTMTLLIEMAILTGVRVSEMRLARWNEIDDTMSLWTVPPLHHKAGHTTGEPHYLPITEPMRAILNEMKRRSPNRTPESRIFPSSQNSGQPYCLSHIQRFLDDSIGWESRINVHGFRATFNGWRQKQQYPDNLYEYQIGHIPHSKTKRAYYRDQLIALRRPMMEAWNEHCAKPAPNPTQVGNNVVEFAREKVGTG